MVTSHDTCNEPLITAARRESLHDIFVQTIRIYESLSPMMETFSLSRKRESRGSISRRELDKRLDIRQSSRNLLFHYHDADTREDRSIAVISISGGIGAKTIAQFCLSKLLLLLTRIHRGQRFESTVELY